MTVMAGRHPCFVLGWSGRTTEAIRILDATQACFNLKLGKAFFLGWLHNLHADRPQSPLGQQGETWLTERHLQGGLLEEVTVQVVKT